ncbi:MAG: hypothetical protein L6Q99_12500 [Planctomycetes bacterium]|nr:hypothetical protein [Planctomycetota bacterium]
MDDPNRKAREARDRAKKPLPPEGPTVSSSEHLRSMERAERLPQNRPGTDKSWTQRVLDEWAYSVADDKRQPPGRAVSLPWPALSQRAA